MRISGGQERLKPSPGSFFVASRPSLVPLAISLVARSSTAAVPLVKRLSRCRAVLALFFGRPTDGANDQLGSNLFHAAEMAGASSVIVCVGRIELVGGEVEVFAQMAGSLETVAVKEGDQVEAGALLAIVDARREKAQLDLANARLERVQAGVGTEEIAAIAAQRDAVAAELTFAESELERARKLKAQQAVSDDALEARQQCVNPLKKQVASLQKQFEAMKRGPLPEELAVARGEVEAAEANYELREVRAPFSGTVLQIHRHTGDGVLLHHPTPILRLADTNQLQVRVEVNETDVNRIKCRMEGSFTVFGMEKEAGQLRVRTVLPAFGPKRLFDPDTSARIDTRTLQVLCDVTERQQPVYPGQRITVRLSASQ